MTEQRTDLDQLLRDATTVMADRPLTPPPSKPKKGGKK